MWSELVFSWSELLISTAEILLLFLGIFFALRFIHGTRGGGIMRGYIIAFIGGFLILLMVSQLLNMSRIRFIIEQWGLLVFALILLFGFQPEIRRGLVRLGQNPLMSSMFGRQRTGPIEEITEAVERLAKNRIGAIITICGDSGLESYIEGGTPMEADISRELLESIFYPGTPLHDGAVIIDGDKIAAAGCLLPLAEDQDVVRGFGTRHRAGIGITVETDATSIIVSEESGKISIASRGEINTAVAPEDVENALQQIYTEVQYQST